MNRRNFILGLGTAATLSGAASVTSAALQGSVEPGADFRVISAQELTVRRNAGIEGASGETDNTLGGYLNTSDSEVDTEGDLNFTQGSGVYETEGPNATVDAEENGALNMSLATPNDNSTVYNRNTSEGGDSYYANTDNYSGNDILEVENLGSAEAEIGVQYGYGDDADANGGPIADGTINTLFTFVDANGNQISPNGTNGDNPGDGDTNSVTVGAGGTEDIGFVLNYSKSIEDTLRNNLDAGFGGSADDLNLLDTVEFGVIDN